MKKSLLYIANWKMYLSYTQASAWIDENKQELVALTKDNALIICPDFTILPTIRTYGVRYGAQNCATKIDGAYTGEISAQTLQDLGCRYCIIGHSERRMLFKETTQECIKKITLLQQYKITPIYCIGEQAIDANDPYTILKEQLAPVIDGHAGDLIIAYEPIWAIGTGKIPETAQLTELIQWIKEYTGNKYPVIYGGSVAASNIKQLKNIAILDGFLIGKSSTDFQELKKIVLS